jgi:hypothetical protein
VEGTREQNEYRKNSKTLSARMTKMNGTSREEMIGKYETITGHLAKYLPGGGGRRRNLLSDSDGILKFCKLDF